MRVSMKVDYGVRALVDLAQHYGEGPVQAAEIADRQRIPEPYLDHLLVTIHKLGYISSRRGPQGGHELACPPGEISLGMIMANLEGTIAPLHCIEVPSECTLSSACAQREVWQRVEEAVQNMLNSSTIADLAYRQQRLAGPEHVPELGLGVEHRD